MNLISYLRKVQGEQTITAEMLKKISRIQAGRKYCLKRYMLDANFGKLWDTISIDNWKIQQRKMMQPYLGTGFPAFGPTADDCRVLDENNRIVSRGTAEEYIHLFEFELMKEKAERQTDKSGYGLVLEGGGGKGAFEIGVWRYLHETGIEKQITGISGASVGALNSLLFVGGNYELAKDLWEQITQWDMTPVNPEILIPGLKRWMVELLFADKPIDWMAEGQDSTLLDTLHPSISSQEKLERIIDEKINWNQVRNTHITAYCSLTAVCNMSKELAVRFGMDSVVKLFKNRTFPEYCCWSKIENEQIKNIVLASAAIPVIYKSRKVSGQEYFDGGIYDNCPVKPLIETGFQKIIVIHLHPLKKDSTDPKWEEATKGLDCRDIEFFHVYPDDKRYDSIAETLTVNSKECTRRMEEGYLAAKIWLSSL